MPANKVGTDVLVSAVQYACVLRQSIEFEPSASRHSLAALCSGGTSATPSKQLRSGNTYKVTSIGCETAIQINAESDHLICR